MSERIKQLEDAGWKNTGGRWRSPTGRHYHVVMVHSAQGWNRQQQALLSQAILEARASAREGERALAIVTMKVATPLQDERLARFAERVAPRDAWILCDQAGHFFPHVPEEPSLKPVMAPRLWVRKDQPTNLFSDTNQWLIKVLLAASVPERLLNAPRRPVRNTSTLAEVAQVSVPAASRFLTALDQADHLDRRFGDLRIKGPLDLLKTWAQRTAAETRDVAVRFVHADHSLGSMRLQYARMLGNLRFARGLYDACDALGFGHVQGVPPLLYLESVGQQVLDTLGAVVVDSDAGFDLSLRVARFPRAVFNAAVVLDGVPTTDIVQCWLDASHYRLRGEEQADYLWRKGLSPLLGEL